MVIVRVIDCKKALVQQTKRMEEKIVNKKYNRLFLLDAADGQEKWLNKMAQRGLRLLSVNYTTYEFESCQPGEYEYHIEVVKGKTKEEILERQKYLARRGIKSIPKSISNNRSMNQAKGHSIGSGSDQIVMVPDLKLPELLILERTKDSEEFEMRSDTAFRSKYYQRLRTKVMFVDMALMLLALMIAFNTDGSIFVTALTLFLVVVILWLSFVMARLTEQAFHFKEQKRLKKEQQKKKMDKK